MFIHGTLKTVTIYKAPQKGKAELFMTQGEIYDRTFKPLERPYQGGELIELPIPQDLFSILNQYPKVLKSR